MSLLASFDEALSAPPRASSSRLPVGGLLSSSSIDWDDLTQTGLISHSDGLCSSIYRRALTSSAVWPYDPAGDPPTSRSSPDSAFASPTECSGTVLSTEAQRHGGLPGWICIKRVQLDAQPRPHSVQRELALLNRLPTHRNVTALLAAVYDTSDPFGEIVDLVLPLYPATLEDVLADPTLSLIPPSTGRQEQGQATGVVGLRHLYQAEHDLATFIHSVAVGLLSGLAFLHAEGVAHRDVKPANIGLTREGTVKLIDLGTAYTTRALRDPLARECDTTMLDGEEGEKMVCQVGTGVYRAPELLFCPVGGYDAFKVDVWAVGVTLAHFFCELLPPHPPGHTNSNTSGEFDLDSFADSAAGELEKRGWEKAYDTLLTQQHLPHPDPDDEDDASDDGFWEEPDSPFHPPHRKSTSYTRKPLFTGESDIALAGSIFTLLGLPTSTKDWPEAQHFQPPLHRLPFPPHPLKTILDSSPFTHLPPLQRQLKDIVDNVISPAIRLSAAARPSAQHLLVALSHP